MRTIDSWPARSWMRSDGVRRLCADRGRHGVVLGERRRMCTLRSPQILWPRIGTTAGHRTIANALARLIRGVVEQSADVVHEKRVE